MRKERFFINSKSFEYKRSRQLTKKTILVKVELSYKRRKASLTSTMGATMTRVGVAGSIAFTGMTSTSLTARASSLPSLSRHSRVSPKNRLYTFTWQSVIPCK